MISCMTGQTLRAKNILGHLHAAMKPGCSKLLLNEGVVSSKNVDALIVFVTSL